MFFPRLSRPALPMRSAKTRRWASIAALLALGALSGCDAPPPMAAQPLPQGAIPYGSYCSAGFYTCPAQGPIGSPCACPGLGAPSYGSIH